MTIADVLNEWKERRSFTNKELAQLSKMSPAHLSRVLSGKQRPGIRTLAKLADALVMDDHARARLLMLVGGEA